jgi:transposase
MAPGIRRKLWSMLGCTNASTPQYTKAPCGSLRLRGFRYYCSLNSLKALVHFADTGLMRPTGTHLQLEVRRRVAVALLEAGWGVRQVARHVKASPRSVRRWREAFAPHAEAGRQAKPHPGGSHPKLPVDPRQQLVDLLRQGARTQGFRNELWPLGRIATVIDRHCGITSCPSGVWHLLRRLGWSPQQPARRARERDEQAIAKWPTADWPRFKKSPA